MARRWHDHRGGSPLRGSADNGRDMARRRRHLRQVRAGNLRANPLAAIDAGKSINEIAADHGVGDRTVSVELRRHGLVERHRRRPTGPVTASSKTSRRAREELSQREFVEHQTRHSMNPPRQTGRDGDVVRGCGTKWRLRPIDRFRRPVCMRNRDDASLTAPRVRYTMKAAARKCRERGSVMAIISGDGFTAPFDEDGEPYGTFGARTPALRTFRLTFGSHRKLALIGVLPGGESQDLNPATPPDTDDDPGPVAPGPVEVPDGRLYVYLQDAHPEGDEFSYEVSHSAVRIPGARRYQLRDVGCVGVCTRVLPFSVLGGISAVSRPLLALVGFKLYFIGGREHNIDRIGVWFVENKLKVAFNDKNDDDTFGYVVDFVVIPSLGLNLNEGELKGKGATGLQTVPLATPSRGSFMLTGFDLNYQKGDHEVRDVGVYRRRNDLTVIHADDAGASPFDWRVSFAQPAPQVFADEGIRSTLVAVP